MSSSNLKTSIPKPAQKPPDEYPSKMIISSIGVDAHVQNTGITKRGSIGTPNNFTDVAWYVYGPVPGKIGTAIFDGHVDNGLGLPGVFKNLSTITVGDDIEIVTNGGKSIHFSVSDVSSFDYDNVPPAAMFSATGTSQIKLISCEGNWVSAEKTYDKRLIVTALLKE
jgi:sortase (surface protein transpeptidase)